jgi:ribosomal protein L5
MIPEKVLDTLRVIYNMLEYHKDIMVKIPNSSPYAKTKIKNVVMHFNYNAAINNKSLIYPAYFLLTQLSGQTPILMKHNESLSQFKVRKNMEIKAKVTLNKKSYLNIHKFLLLKINSFHSGSFNGNYSISIDNIAKLNLNPKFEKTTGLSINYNLTGKENISKKFYLSSIGLLLNT